jgi:hypothetical protein
MALRSSLIGECAQLGGGRHLQSAANSAARSGPAQDVKWIVETQIVRPVPSVYALGYVSGFSDYQGQPFAAQLARIEGSRELRHGDVVLGEQQTLGER